MAWICDKNGNHKCEIKQLSYNGTFMEVSSITVTVESPAPIAFSIGDYIDWDYDGLRYTLDTAAGVEKQARRNSVGNAFLYENLVFLSPLQAAQNADFFDVILGNTNDFLTNTEFSFYGTSWDYAKRLEANLCRIYGSGTWKVRIWTSGTCYDATPATGLDTGAWENKLVDVSGIKCLGGFQQIYDLWGCAYVFSVVSGVNYVDFYDDFEQYAKAWQAGGVDKIFAYGKGNGLYKIRHTPDADHVLVTRLRPYGSGDNIPANYYLNSEDYHIEGNESSELAISHLMLPASQWTKDGVKHPSNAYLEQNTDLYGVREGVMLWDGSDPELGEIKPSIYRLSIQDLLDLMVAGDSYRPDEAKWPDTTQRIDKIITGAVPTDNGVKNEAGYDFTEIESSGSLAEHSFGTGGAYIDVEFNDLVMGTTPSVSHLAEFRIVPTSENKVAASFDVQASVASAIRAVNAYLTPYVGGVKISDATYPCTVTEEAISNTVEGITYTKRYKISLLDSTGNPIVFSSMYTGNVTFRIVAHIDFIGNPTGFPVVRNEYAVSFNLVRGNKAIDEYFSVTIPQIGFDLAAAVANGAKLCMRSGANQPREFAIVPSSVRYLPDTDTWYVRCKRSVDQSISTYFPNSNSVIATGDEYYLTGIVMPPLYVEIAAQKLLTAATAWLNLHSKPRMLSAVDVDNKIMAVDGIVLKEGMSLPISDTDLGIQPSNQESRVIDNIRIEEGTDAIRTFSVTLRDKKEKSALDAAIRGATSNFATASSVNEAVNAVANTGHDSLTGRDMPNQHPISAITGLEDALLSSGFFEIGSLSSLVQLKAAYSYLGTRLGLLFDVTPEADVASSPAHLMLRNLGTQANPNYALYTPLPLITGGDQIVVSGTPGQGGGGGGAGYLYELNDVADALRAPSTGTMIFWNGSSWVGNTLPSGFGAGYVPQWDGSKWTAVAASSIGGVTSVVGQTGAVTAEQISSALSLGAAATYGVGSVTSGNTGLVTGGAVWSAIDALPEPMVFKGSLGTGGTIQALPVNGTAQVGDTYKVITAGTYAGQTAKVGDTFICQTKTASANTWVMIPSGDEPEGTVTSVGLSLPTGLVLDTVNGSASPITESGTFVLAFQSGYAIPTTADVAKGVAARDYFDANGVLTYGHGGTGRSTAWTENSVIYASSTSVLGQVTNVSGNNQKKFLVQTTNASGTASAPSWGSLAFSDLPTLYLGTTQIQSSSATQSVTGVIDLTMSGDLLLEKTGGGITLRGDRNNANGNGGYIYFAARYYDNERNGAKIVSEYPAAGGLYDVQDLVFYSSRNLSGGASPIWQESMRIMSTRAVRMATSLAVGTTLSVTELATLSGGATIPAGKTLTIGDAEITWVAGVGGADGYLKISTALVTQGDQIVGDGTPGGGGGGGGAQNLYQLSDVYGSVSVLRADGSAKQPGDVLAYNGSLDKWAATPMVQSVAGLTGAVTAAQIATALTNAGYKLTDTIYTLPAATTSALGGIQLGYTQSGKNYPVQLSSNKAYVNVPWTDTTYSSATTSAAGLMSAADKVKLNGIATGATNVTASTVSGWGFLTASAAAAAYQAKGSYVTYDKTTPPTDVNTPDSGTPSIRIIHSGLGPTDNFTPGPYGLLADFAVAAGHLQFGTNTTQNEVYVRSYWWATRSSDSTPFPGYPAWVKLYHSANLTKSVLTGLLEGNNGYYVKRAGDVMSGPLSGVTYLSVNNAAQTTYRFYVNGAAAVTGQLDIGNSSVSNINFKRGSASYITAPTDGYFTFVPNGLVTNNGNSPLIVTAGSIYPGAETDLGRSSSYWHYAYVNRVYLASGAYLEYNSTNGYIYISKPIVTEGDQIVASGTPGGGGGGGASFLYDLMDTLAGWTANTGVTTGQVLMYQAGANSKRGSGTGAWKYGTLAISNISGLQAALDAKQASGNYVTSVKVGSTSYAPSSGVVSLPAYPTTLPASDVYAWAKAAAKPSYTLDEVADGSTRKLSNYLYGTSNKSIVARATDNSNTWGALGFDDGDNAAFNFKVIRFGASPGASFGGSLSAYGSGLFFGGADTRAFMAVRYASGHVEFGGGSVSSPNNTPAWHFGINGTNGATYDLPTIATNASNGNTAYNSLGNYVLKAGDTMTGPLTVTGAANILLAADSAHATASYIRLRYNTGGTAVTGYIGLSSGKLVYHSGGDKEIWHAGNFVAGTHYVSISGTETITGAKTFTGGLYLKFANPRVVFQAADGTVHGNVAMRSAGVLEFYDLSSYRIVYHAGNANLSTVDWQAANLTAYALGLRRSSDGTVVFRITNPASTTEWRTAASGGGGFFTWYTNVNSTTAERMRLDNSGNLGIGTNAPTQKLHVAGTILSTGDQVISSDATLKTNFSRINYSVSDIAACRAVTFDWKDGRGRSAGSIAQDWKPLIPELVHGEDGNMTLAYGQIALVNTIILARHETEQDKEIKRLKARVEELEKQLKERS